MNLGVGIVALAGEPETILIGKLPDTFKRRSAQQWDVVVVEVRDELLVASDAFADILERRLFVAVDARARTFQLLEDVVRSKICKIAELAQ